MSSAPSHSSADANYPPLPKSGPQEDSDLAHKNFTERERLSRSWHARLFSKQHGDGVTLLERRTSKGTVDSENSSSSVSLDAEPTASAPLGETLAIATTAAVVPEASASQQRVERLVSDTGTSLDTGRISVKESDEEDPTKDQHLYRWAMVYENQRGISIFSTRRYSSRSLLPKDPPPFSIATPAPSVMGGKPVVKASQPDISLDDYPFPDGNWRWASKEWMIDMREKTVQHDGFEYNWFFRSKGWRSKAGRLNAGAWVRRRRWLRLMERPPLSALKQGEETGHPSRAPEVVPSVGLEDVWRGDDDDWPRLHRAMRVLGRDGRQLEVWKEWIYTAKSRDSEDSARLATRSMTTVLRAHKDELLRLFVFPSSRIEFLKIVTRGDILSKAEVLRVSETSPSFVDRSHLQEALPAKS